MSSQAFSLSLRRSSYICDTCLGTARHVHPAQLHNIRAFSTASSQSYNSHPRQTPHAKARKRRLTTTHHANTIIANCPATARFQSSEASTPQAIEYGIAPLPHRRLISLSGPDAAKFLHGLITNSVDSTRLTPFYSAFLDARGRVLWDVFIWVWPELVAQNGHWSCYIEVDASELDALKKQLKKHKLRSKITIKEVPEEGAEGIRVWAAWGGAHEKVHEWSEIAGLQDPRAPGLYRYIANADRDTIAEDLPPVTAKYYDIQRYLYGVPEGPTEIPRESSLPMESNVDLNGGIDFKKGCYVGQELTIRTKHTGVVRKRILPVRFHSQNATIPSNDIRAQGSEGTSFRPTFSPQPLPGTDIKALDEAGVPKKGRAAGKIIAAIGNVGLASCRLENMTPMRISAEGGTYRPGMQFGVDVDEEVVKVEPVLYDWFVQRKEALWDKEERKKARMLESEDLD